LTAAQLGARAAENALVLLPVASTEQHGPHLPTGVDVMLCGEVCRRAADILMEAGRPAVVAPVLWPGLAEHHVPFGGTFTLSLATWAKLLEELCRSILRAGFRRIVIVNGHGGNIAALAALGVELTKALDAPVAATTYFAVAEAEIAALIEDQRGVLHACEVETSMMMALHPDLVDRAKLSEASGPNPTGGAASVLAPPLMRWRSFAEITPTGVIGDARRATPEKGAKLIEAVAAALARRLAAGEPWSA
jgi:creatinine amidohydrolase